MQSPSGGWDSGVSVAVSSLGYSTGASVVTSTLAASASAYTYASDVSSAYYTYASDVSSAYYTYASDASSTASYASGADPSGTAAVKAAGNLAETDDEDLNNQVDYYKNKVRSSLIYIPACMLGAHMLLATGQDLRDRHLRSCWCSRPRHHCRHRCSCHGAPQQGVRSAVCIPQHSRSRVQRAQGSAVRRGGWPLALLRPLP